MLLCRYIAGVNQSLETTKESLTKQKKTVMVGQNRTEKQPSGIFRQKKHIILTPNIKPQMQIEGIFFGWEKYDDAGE